MKTFQHKTLQVLATLTEKTVWMSTLQGKIYKQFPLQFWNEAQFNNDPIPFPTDWDTALAHFKQGEARKRAEREAKMAEKAERRRIEAEKEYEERKRLTRILWNARKQVMTQGKTKLYALVIENGYDANDYYGSERDPNWQMLDGYPMWFGDKDSAMAVYNNAYNTLNPEYGYEMELCIWEVEFGEELLDFCVSDELKSVEYNYGIDIKTDWVSHRNYRSIEGAVIVWWQWVTYTGYCRKFIQIEIGERGKTEYDLLTHNFENTYKDNASVLAYAEDLKGLSRDEQVELIYEKLMALGKWEYRKMSPCREDVEGIVELLNR